jgi:hypothetical protein
VKPIKLAEGYPTSKLRCPECEKINDAASAVVELTEKGNPQIKPKPGDLSICIYCGHFSVFNDELQLRPMTEDEKKQWAGNPMVVSVSKALAELKKRN